LLLLVLFFSELPPVGSVPNACIGGCIHREKTL
jgi:hypothetical protein